MWVQLRREVAREEFDDATVLFLFEGRTEHLSVFREVHGFVVDATCLVLSPDCRDFCCYEFLSGGRSEGPVVGRAIPHRSDVALDCFWIFIFAEGSVNCFFPGECEGPDVFEHV